jgi:hypothetical protein
MYTKISQNCKLFSFAELKKKILANFQRIIELFTQKSVTKLSKILKAPDPGSGSATLQKNPENGILSGFKIFGTENILTLSQGSSDASKLTSSSR